jgi:cytochrome P450
MPTTTIDYNPYAYEIHEDPYPTYARLRDEAPVFHNPEIGFWALSRHEDVVAGFRDSARLSSAHGVSLDPAATGPNAHRTVSFLAMDPPRHGRMRGLVSRGFTPRRVAELEPRIRELTRQHLQAALEHDHIDFIADFAGKVPMDVISELMGVPPADRAEVRRLADLLVHREEGVNDVPPEGMAAALELVGYYDAMLAARQTQRTDDLTSALLDAEVDGDRLTREEIIGFLFLMVVAGNETTRQAIALGTKALAEHPEQYERLRADRSLIGSAVDELLRFSSPVWFFRRTATVDTTIGDRAIAAGDKVVVWFAAGNRDPDKYPDPHRLDVARPAKDHLTFGRGGPHQCLGMHLARLELKVYLEELVERVARVELAGPPVRLRSNFTNGLKHLPVRVQPA